jgi:hypothetical protein
MLLQKFGKSVPGAADIVNEEVAKMTSNKKASPKKPKTADNVASPPATPSPSKRKGATKPKIEMEEESVTEDGEIKYEYEHED